MNLVERGAVGVAGSGRFVPMSVFADAVKRVTMNDQYRTLAQPAAPSQSNGERIALAIRLHRQSLDKADHFQTEAVRNAPWDVMLSLFVARSEGLEMPFASLCAANRLSRPAAERAVEALAGATLARWSRAGDEGGACVELTARGAAKIDQFLQRVASSA